MQFVVENLKKMNLGGCDVVEEVEVVKLRML